MENPTPMVLYALNVTKAIRKRFPNRTDREAWYEHITVTATETIALLRALDQSMEDNPDHPDLWHLVTVLKQAKKTTTESMH